MLPQLHAPLLSATPGVRHAFYTRRGGASRGLYASLNFGRGSKDDPRAVETNRALAAEDMGAAPERLLTAYQIHSNITHVVDRPWARAPEGDALVTGAPRLILGALSADCAPILLADGEAQVVASAHAGWKGAIGGVIDSVVEAMCAQGARRAHIVAAVGPCIAQPSYEVGRDFLERFERDAPDSGRFFAPGADVDKRQFDLPGFVLDRLRRAGVERCEWIGRDTCAEPAEFYSNRRAVKRGEGDYGRLMSVIMLHPDK
jgi:YfiH family protein